MLDWTTRSTRDLGVIVDDCLTISDHIMSIVHKSNVCVYVIYVNALLSVTVVYW